MTESLFDRLDDMQREALIRKLHRQGLSGSEIARQVGLSRQRVHQLFQQLRLMARVPPSTLRRRKMPALIRRGHCGTTLAEHFQVPLSTIYYDLRAVCAEDETLQPILRENTRLARSRAKKAMWSGRG